MSATVGTKAPVFTLPNQDNEPVTVKPDGKNVVLAFFPAAFTSVCQKELCYFRDHLATLNEANATVYGISVDHPASLQEFRRQNAFTFDLLSDFNREVIAQYDVLNPDSRGFRNISRRAVVVIDGEGVIRHREITAHPGVEPDYEKVHEVLGRIGSVRV